MGRSSTENFNHRVDIQRPEVYDLWLPIPSSRSAKWWYPTVYSEIVIVGVGVLHLPYSMSNLGWGPGLSMLTLSWIITLYTQWQMVEMHEAADGTRFDRYHELGQYAFGEKLGLFIVLPLHLITHICVNIMYVLVGGISLERFSEIVCPDCNKMRLTFWIMISSSIHVVISHLPHLNSLSGVSLAAALLSFSYCTIAWATAAGHGVHPDVQYGYRTDEKEELIFEFVTSLGYVAQLYGCHNVAMEIHATIPSPSKKRMWRGIVFAYVIVALCYFPTAIIGYWMFGNSVSGNILESIGKPAWLIAAAYMFVFVQLVPAYQIYAMPVFDMIERLLVCKCRCQPSKMLSFILRNVYVAFTVLVASATPSVEVLLFFEALAFLPTTYFLPCIIWLTLFKPRRFSFSWWTNWICIVYGSALTAVTVVGGLRGIIVQAKNYKLFPTNLQLIL